MPDSPAETITGLVKTITFHNEANGYTVARILPENGGQAFAAVGNVTFITEGETVRLHGRWGRHSIHGEQFEFESCVAVLPSSVEGIKRFLASKYIKGIGPVTAERIVDTFGADTLRVLDEDPKQLRKVPKLSKKQRESLLAGWADHHRIRDIMIFLRDHDISEAYASRIYEKYRDRTIEVMRSNPYQLIDDIRGIGFLTADKLAGKVGVERSSPGRVRAGVRYSLDESEGEGHVYVPLETLVERAAGLLELDADLVTEAVEYLKEQGTVAVEDGRVYTRELWEAEREVAARLAMLARTPREGKQPSVSEVLDMVADIEREQGVELAAEQRNAVIAAASVPSLVITGGPGTGKTTTVRSIIGLYDRLGVGFLLCTPTGRAAKRLAETTGRDAQTIHRLLEYNPFKGRFTRNASNPLVAQAVIMDEASMVDIRLMADFLRALHPATTLIMVGDVDQLPSIGPGSVLRDIIDSGALPTVRLTEIFRQAAASRIVQSAHRINTGNLPHLDNKRSGDFFVITMHEPPDIAAAIVDMVARRLPARYGFDPVDDIQVLSPMHKGETGVAALNDRLRERLNPPGPRVRELRRGNRLYREGDKVMQIRNNYDKMIFNGDIGRIERIEGEREEVVVRFDSTVVYTGSEMDDLVPAYAVSVHKSQGSEFRCIVMPVTTQHFIMLKRNLLYTAVTRARELAVLIGDVRAMAIAVKNDQVRERFTTLADRLRESGRDG